LQANALRVGSYLKRQLRRLQASIPLIGDVRGEGLFLGLELVRDLETLEPASTETSSVCSTLKSSYNILTSIDGPDENVLVIKPPLVFSKDDADFFVTSLKCALTKHLVAHGPELDKGTKSSTYC
jgi:4-aminobutyrate aminotransferase-like enzyme